MLDDSDDPGVVYVPRKWFRSGLSTTKRHVLQVVKATPAERFESTLAWDEFRSLASSTKDEQFAIWMAALFGPDIPGQSLLDFESALNDGSFPNPKTPLTAELPSASRVAYDQESGVINVSRFLARSARRDKAAAWKLGVGLLAGFGQHVDHMLRTRYSTVGGAAVHEGLRLGYSLLYFGKDRKTVRIGRFITDAETTPVAVDVAALRTAVRPLTSSKPHRAGVEDGCWAGEAWVCEPTTLQHYLDLGSYLESRNLLGPQIVNAAYTPSTATKSYGNGSADGLAAMSAAQFNGMINSWCATGALGELDLRMDRADMVAILRVIGARATRTQKETLSRSTPTFDAHWENHIVVFAGQYAGTRGPRALAPASLKSLVSSDPDAPFTSMALIGKPPREAPMSYVDMWKMYRQWKKFQEMLAAKKLQDENDAKYNRYPGLEMLYDWSNPNKLDLVGPGSWLGGVPAADRVNQVRLLFQQPIVTSAPEAYDDPLPTRAQLVRSAAAAHNLGPEIVAAIILAEQRDQSRREDAADYNGAVYGGRRGASVGIGQVTIKTATMYDLFADLVAPSLREGLSSATRVQTIRTANMLSSDDLSIFAVARYIRIVANVGASKDISSLPNTASAYGNLNLSLYGGHSSHWTEQHVGLLGSEYTSEPFDDGLRPGWGEFVREAYRDVLAAHVF